MVTTIQVDEKTLILLRRLKEELNANSYDETIKKLFINQTKKKSMAGSLKRYMGKQSLKDILKDLRDENDRI